MKKLKAVTLTMIALLVLLAAGGAVAQAAQHFGERIDPKAPKMTLAQLIAKPDDYQGKTVVVDGTHGGACADGEDFYFKDKFDIIEVVPPSPEIMQVKKGARVRVYGTVKVRRRGSEAEVRIIAKGAEVL